MFKVTNISTTDLALRNGVNLAPGKSTTLEGSMVDVNLRNLESSGAVRLQRTKEPALIKKES